MTVSSEARLGALIPHIPSLEERARALQADTTTPADQGAIEGLRDDYLQWYAQCLIVVPQMLQAKFRDFYEGGPSPNESSSSSKRLLNAIHQSPMTHP